MSRLFYHVMQDNLGNLLFDVSGTMRIAGSGTLATIYGDEELTVILPNPMTNHPSYGSFKCFLGAGDYDFYMAKSGYTFETLTGVQGHGTMAQQDASAVAITGGSVANVTLDTVNVTGPLVIADRAGNNQHGLYSNLAGASAGTGRFFLLGATNAQSQFQGNVGLYTAPLASNTLDIRFARAARYGLYLRPSDADTGGLEPVLFANLAGTGIGSITTTASATAFNTASDARLKRDIAPLTGALDVVRALRPVSFLWKADGSPGRGFVADEVAEVVDGVITGDKDAVDEEGSIRPQMIDHSKLVVYLVGACKELAAQVEALTARLEACGG